MDIDLQYRTRLRDLELFDFDYYQKIWCPHKCTASLQFDPHGIKLSYAPYVYPARFICECGYCYKQRCIQFERKWTEWFNFFQANGLQDPQQMPPCFVHVPRTFTNSTTVNVSRTSSIQSFYIDKPNIYYDGTAEYFDVESCAQNKECFYNDSTQDLYMIDVNTSFNIVLQEDFVDIPNINQILEAIRKSTTFGNLSFSHLKDYETMATLLSRVIKLKNLEIVLSKNLDIVVFLYKRFVQTLKQTTRKVQRGNILVDPDIHLINMSDDEQVLRLQEDSVMRVRMANKLAQDLIDEHIQILMARTIILQMSNHNYVFMSKQDYDNTLQLLPNLCIPPTNNRLIYIQSFCVGANNTFLLETYDHCPPDNASLQFNILEKMKQQYFYHKEFTNDITEEYQTMEILLIRVTHYMELSLKTYDAPTVLLQLHQNFTKMFCHFPGKLFYPSDFDPNGPYTPLLHHHFLQRIMTANELAVNLILKNIVLTNRHM